MAKFNNKNNPIIEKSSNNCFLQTIILDRITLDHTLVEENEEPTADSDSDSITDFYQRKANYIYFW